MSKHLLMTKIQIPPLPQHPVRRERLLKALDRGLQEAVRVTLISAPAGYGKTTLLSSWIHSRGVNTAWFSISEGDNDPARFLSYLILSLDTITGDMQLTLPGEQLLTLEEVRQDHLVPLLNVLSQQKDPLVFVLDDYYLIQNQVVQDMMAYLLENAPSHVHFFLATRADPALPLARLRGRGQVNDIRMNDLRFEVEEAVRFFAGLPELNLDQNQISTLHRRTEGWISGLQMISVVLRGRNNVSDFIRSFSGSHHYIMDYLQDEVLNQVPEEIHNFLLRTSILDRLTGSLCDALREKGALKTMSGSEILRELEQANLFIIPLDERREWYRYHHLFSDLLRSRLARQDPDCFPQLHRYASDWFERHGFIDEAVEHALESRDSEFAADLVEKYAQTILMRSETTTYLHWVQELPPEQMRRRPRLTVYRAWALLLQGSPLAMVEVMMEEGCDIEKPSGSVCALEAFILMSQGKVREGVRMAEEALDLLPEDELYLRNVAIICAAGGRISLGEVESGIQMLDYAAEHHQRTGNRAAALMILCETAELRVKQMRFDEAEQLYQRALQLGPTADGGLVPIAGQAKMGLGTLALERFELEKAENLLLEGIDLSRRWSLISTLEGHFSLSLLYSASGETRKLQDTLDVLEDLTVRFDASELDDVIVGVLRERVHAWRGDQDSLAQWVSERELNGVPEKKPARFSEDMMASRIYKYELPIAIRWLMAEGRFEQALRAIQELEEMAAQADRPHLIIEANLLRAHTLLLQGDRDSALQKLHKAVLLAHPARASRQFLVEGDAILDLLRLGKDHWKDPEAAEFAGSLLDMAKSIIVSGSGEKPGTASDLFESLSARELEVLRMLPSSLTAEALAKKLVISVNTLRTHMKSIYAKLGVHSRHEAVVKASELDLL